MENLLGSFKKFISNRNTVTLVGTVLIILIIYFGYNYRVGNAIDGVSIPVANTTIPPNTLITSDMVTYVTIANAGVPSGIYWDRSSIVGKYTSYNSLVPEGSFFFAGENILDEENLPNAILREMGEDEVAYSLSVNVASTYGNSILPDNTVDIYMKAEDDEGRIMVGKLVEDANVLAVQDSSGQNVFRDLDNVGSPAYFIIPVDEDLHLLLIKANYLSQYDVELFPVATATSYSTDMGETLVSSQILKEFIEAKTVYIPLDGGGTYQDLIEAEDNEEEE